MYAGGCFAVEDIAALIKSWLDGHMVPHEHAGKAQRHVPVFVVRVQAVLALVSICTWSLNWSQLTLLSHTPAPVQPLAARTNEFQHLHAALLMLKGNVQVQWLP
jgi:hypothetical protein